MNGNNKQPDPREALQYITELVAEYMQTLPPPVRKPVVAAVNYNFRIVGDALIEKEKDKK